MILPFTEPDATTDPLDCTDEQPFDTDTLTEVVSLREPSVKTFLKPDGGYVAAIYGDAVHYQDDNGNWQEIDNTLTATTLLSPQPSVSNIVSAGPMSTTTVAAPVPYRQNNSNSFRVRLPQVLSAQSPVTVNHGGHSLAFSLQGVSLRLSEIPDAPSSATVQSTTDDPTAIPDKTGMLTYDQVFPNTRLTYEVRGQKLKESLIFSAPPTEENYQFRFYYENLYPRLEATGEVLFFDNSAMTGDPVFSIQAPYMFDSADGYSNAITVTVEPCEGGCLYTFTPDSSWLNDAARVYPVTLDPTISTPINDQTLIHDNSVHQSDPNTNYINADRLYVGSVVLSSGTFESRTYIKFPRLSDIDTDDFILSATMTLHHHENTAYQSASNNEYRVYDCGDNVWGTSNITWNVQKDFEFPESDFIDKQTSNSDDETVNFNITRLVRRWYSTTTANNGLVIKPTTVHRDVSNRTAYYSSDISSSKKDMRPQILIEYYNGTPSAGIVNNEKYFIQSVHSGYYVTVPGNGNSQTYLTQSVLTGSTMQTFQTKYEGGGVYSLIPQHDTDLRIDVSNGWDQDGTDLWVFQTNDTAAQYFRIIANGDGTYRLMPLNSSTRVMDVEGASISSGAKIQIWTWDSTATQMRWVFRVATPPTLESKGAVNEGVYSGLRLLDTLWTPFAINYVVTINCEYWDNHIISETNNIAQITTKYFFPNKWDTYNAYDGFFVDALPQGITILDSANNEIYIPNSQLENLTVLTNPDSTGYYKYYRPEPYMGVYSATTLSTSLFISIASDSGPIFTTKSVEITIG